MTTKSASKPIAVVTGGAGFIGSHTVDLLLENDFAVRVVDNFTGGHEKNLAHHASNPDVTVDLLRRVLLAMYIPIQGIMFYALFGFVVGTALHTILMDAVPKEREGRPSYFILGVVLYTFFIYLTWIL